MKEKEVRVLPVAEVRAVTDDDGTKHVEGYAIRFNELSEDLGGWKEKIAPTAINLDHDLRAFYNHNTDYIIGRQSAGTLRAEVRDDGVWFEAEPPDTSWADDMLVSMSRGDLNQCSFGFYCSADSWAKEDGVNVRTVEDAEVFEVSIVAMPAYNTTSAQARSANEALNEAATATQRDAAEALSEAPQEAGETSEENETKEDDAGRVIDLKLKALNLL